MEGAVDPRMAEDHALPLLPEKYRDLAPVQESYGFRRGAFGLSLAFLVAGIGLWLAPERGGDQSWTRVLGVACVLVFVVSAVFSRGWSDRPTQGVRRVLGDMQFVALGVMGIATCVFVAYILTRLGWLFFSGGRLTLAFLGGIPGLLCVVAWRLRVADRIRRRDRELVGAIDTAAFQQPDLMSGGHGPAP